ncbi:dynein axonemal heavy chain 11 isoform X1 [Marmota marmota marmota]|uniref:dynein axonemal heavy chain 11 isoform X1 n=4 Tax=Marmota marmota marmota TaxID=9994 RepID=UPI0020929D34|nr:dynein axonemal heavy chain 11 isoform X1 [Marmota marmota marmota]
MYQMAARGASSETQGFLEVPTLRQTPGTRLQASGSMEFEEEEEEEEEAEARRARSFAQDPRVRFLQGHLEQMLGLLEENWNQYLASEENRQVLGEFLESISPVCLVFSIATTGRLAVSREIPRDAKHKVVYIAKKITESIGVNDLSRTLLFGELPASSLGHITAFLDEILVPILSNKTNHKSWSCFTSQDMEHHVEVMKNKMHIFRGKMSRRTLLPIPTIAENIDLDQNYSETKLQSNERRILHAVESVVINWSHQIQEIVEKDSMQPLLNGLHLTPQSELDFWTMRRENLSCTYNQLKAPVVLKMVKILKTKKSSYFSTLKDIFMTVENALLEAQDIELYLSPLRRHIERLQETEFPQIHLLVAPLFHTICLIWSHSKFYSTPARIIVLLQEFCNLFIEQAIAYLSPEDLLKGEIEDSLEKVQVAINILKSFKHSFFNYRKRLTSYFMGNKDVRTWDFPSHLVFCRFDKFLDRLMKIEDVFVTMLEFEKLERLEFGGIRGTILNEQICKMNEEFIELCKVFKHSSYDPSDCNNMEFEHDYAAFKSQTLDFDRRLGTVVCEGFCNCNGLEAAFKLLTIFGNFLEKPVVMEIFSPHYSTLMNMLNTELDMCKQLYNEHMEQIEHGCVVLNKNMPFTSGNIKWAREILDRLQMFWSNFSSLHYLFSDNPDEAAVYQKYVEMTTLLDQFENHIYNKWKANVDEICEFNLNQPLVKFSAINGLLSVNFDPKLVAVLREVKYLLMMKKSDIPDSALAIFQKRNTILKYIGNLELLVQGYNKLKQTLLEVEYPLIEEELGAIDEQLEAAVTWLTWQHDCWGYVEKVQAATAELECRVEHTQNNLQVIQQMMRAWAECPLLPRREHRKEAALTLEDKGDLFAKKYKLIQEDGCKIHNLVEENRKLFKVDPSLDTWKIYVEFIDDMVVEGFFQAIMCDLDFFLTNTEKQPKPAPFFQVQMILTPPEIVFKPSLEREAGDGFYDLVEEMLCNSFRMSAQMERVAAHLEITNYQNDMDNMLGLAEVRREIMNRVEDVISKVLDFRNSLETYAYLWVDDRAEFMKHFLQYGHTAVSEEMDAHANEEIPEQPPTLEQFKEQIDIYEALYVQMSKFDDFRVFNSWFKVDMRPFKVSLLNVIKKWSWMFQEHLLRFVIDSLNELQGFMKVTDGGLQRQLSEGDHEGLVDIMGHLLAVRSRQRATDELFEPLKETITLLESYGQKMPEQVYVQLEELPERWQITKKIAATVRHEVSPLQNAEVTLIRKKCILFDEKQAEFRERFQSYAPLGFNAENPYTVLDQANQELEALEEEMMQMQDSARLFEVALPEYRQMKQCRKEIKLLKGLWDVIIYVRRSIDNWTNTQWRQINVEQMDVELRRFAKEIWSLDKVVRVWEAYAGLEGAVKDMTTSLRAVAELQSPALRDRHWHQLMKAIGVNFSINEATTLADLLALQLHRVEDDVRSIVDKAVKELGTEKVITEISQTWATMEFSYEVHYRTSIPLLKSDEQLFETLEHNQVQLQTLLQSKYVEYFIEQVLSWQNKLNILDSVIFTWMEVQRTWSHLESIFVCSEDIRIQLVEDARRFDGVDAEFKELMLETAKIKNVLEAACRPLLYEKLKDLQYRLSLCEKALAEYLETKRVAFPRFYFISSADLLDILSKGAQPKQVTRHLAKLFDSITDLQFEDNQDASAYRAVGMYSKEKEYVPFQAKCECIGHVETWLLQLEQTMQETVRQSITEAIVAYEETPRELWIFDFPAQVALTSSQIWWTTDVGIAFSRLEEGYETALKDFHKKQISQLNTLITLLLGELPPGDRQKIMTICTIDVHARDVVAKLISQKVVSPQAFAWLSQLRHQWEDTQKHCIVNICDAQFQYFYEYLGNNPRLVITPLTDRCYITLTQSLHLTMSGAPSGPAGTGKTETTKDLGRALGMMVYVFNCSEQMDYKSIGNVYKGLVQTGAWGCFDEFNRIAVEVLSVVAVQVKMIHDAIRNRKQRFVFLGEAITLKPSVGIFITMNPGYAGRTELPENLKALFRPCAMVAPDIELICEIMLVAEGFVDARSLARKFISLYTLCKELLSKQDHYDWGLRAIKSVLVVAGSLKRGDKNRPEDQVLMRALRDFNMPKVVTDDVPVFLGLIGDLFPALEVPRRRKPHFEQMVRQSTLELCLQPEESFILKVIQLEELLTLRHSVFVVGNAGTGKSKILRTLNRTYVNMKQKPVWNDLNPKAVTTDELFGFIHHATREWKDGLFSFILREQANLMHDDPKWIVLDGDIDPTWIESLNTVMDDNKVLTLASNERVALTPSMRLLFEIHHLRTATPATVSRAGILYVNPQDLGWNPYVASWIDRRQHQSEKANLTILFDKYVPACLDKLRTSFKTITSIPENSLVQTICTLLECLLTPENVPLDSPKEVYEVYFVFACIWAFGGTLLRDQLSDYPANFSRWWHKEMKAVKFPSQETIFDYYLDHKTKKFLPWADKIPQFTMDPDVPLQKVLVHTSETTRLRYFIELLLKKGKPLMLVGNAGVGKTVFMSGTLASLSEEFLVSRVPFNYYTSSAALQRILEKPLEKKAGRNYGPGGNKKLVYFLDDMNMPEVDLYGTVQPHALIRQHIDYGHWYDRQKVMLKEIHHCQYVACMNPTVGSFTINPRLQRHFTVFAFNFPSLDALNTIYGQIFSFHFQHQEFGPSVFRSGPSLIQATIVFHQMMTQTFLPTAIKFHYIFNLRDLSNIFQGILFASPECLKVPNDLMHLWLHESSRVYGDKLTDTKDCDLFQKKLLETAYKYFEGVNSHVLLQQPLVYCHFAHGGRDPCYMPVKDWEVLKMILMETLDNYNELNAAMHLVLFEDAMQHVCRISRILRTPRGYALLIGVGGSGKQSLSRLAAYICSLEVFQITLTEGYGIQELRVDLANLYIRTGAKNMPTVFLLTDAHVLDESFLVLINDLLASGEIPDLFSDEDADKIVSGIRNEVRGLGIVDSRENCWKFFLARVQLQLKIILCFSPVGHTLRVRARKFPAIVNCTAIDWFHAWPKEALVSVSRRFIEDTEGIEPLYKDCISLFMAHVHTSVNEMSTRYYQNERRHNYTTPKSFLEQISLFKNLLKKKQKEVFQKKEHLVNGIQKLKTTASQVGDLKARLASQEAELQLRNQDAEALITKIGLQTEKVSREKAISDTEERKVAAIQTEVSQKQRECEADLLKAEPALVAATAALNTLNRINLTELKTFPNPPNAVTNVTAAVMVLLAPRGRVPKDRSWKAAKIFMGKVDDFLQALINYDKEHIPENCLKVVNEQYLKDPEFNPNLIQTKSFAAAGLCAWVINIIKFYEVYCDVEPKRQALAQANLELAAATEKLEAIRKKLVDLDQNLSKLTASFEKAIAEKVRCQEEVNQTNKTIELANRLVKELESEKIRWGQNIKSFEAQEKTLCGDVLLTAAFVSYVGPFTKQYRQELVHCKWVPFLQQKVSIPITEGLDVIAMLTDDATIAAWNNEGLPNDRMSAENATILTHCERWPLMIDPQQQGIKWIKNKYGADLKVTHLGQKGFLNAIETALAFGDIILVENLEETIDPVLDPLLGRNTIKKGKYIRIGDKECEFNKNFRLILHTKLANPHYKPELQAQTTLLNFTVTEDGLEAQLLAEVVSIERPDLEKLKLVLTKHQNDFKIELKHLEDDLLLRLSAAEGSFLDDTNLVERLETTKATAAEIEHKVIEAKENERKINEARECYRPVAARASLLYFVINDLRKINPIYQFSLKAFNMLFHRAIEQADKVEDPQGRISVLMESITHTIFLYTSQALFEKDKLTFLSHMAFQILLRKKEVDPLELDFLLRFPVEHTCLSPLDFLTTQSWSAIKALALMEEFRGIDRDVEGSSKQWRKWVESECPEKEKLPQEWKKKSWIQKLIILRAVRPDRMTYALRNFVEEKLGAKYVERTRLDLGKAFEESSPATPVFFILSPGVDALKDLEVLGKRLGFTIDSGKFHNVSLGQGQETVAEMALQKASRGGHWVMLQNVHLVAKWLGTLEKLLERYSHGSHEDYRVFMSAESARTPDEHIIPQGLLENSIKITNEPPTGMLANLHAALYNFDPDTLEMCSKEQEFKSILFSLCYFHACVAGRLRFGPQGWSRSYPFNPGDLTICANVLYNYLEANPNVPWEDLRYLFGEIMYGGHITDDWDRKLCRVYLEEFMNPSLIEDELMLAPGFAAPPYLDYSGYHQYIEEALPPESPTLYGLHPNAEIEFLTVTSSALFRTLLEMQPRNLISSEELGQSMEEKVKNVLDDILEKLPEEFNMAEIMQKNSNRSPYVLVCFQECERMNILIREIRASLQQLNLGLKGELTLSPDVEAQQLALSYDIVPDTWSKLAYPSTYGLAQWFNDFLLRCRELDMWTQDLALPAVVWLSGFFNPQSFLTAIMQTMARKNEWPLDRMCLTVDVTKKTKEDYSHPPREGAYLHGLLMEGARWDPQSGTIVEARLKELKSMMPVIFAKAIPVDRQETKHTYACPVYKTKTRGPTYVWTFRLKSKEKTAKWVLAGVALLLEA